MSDTAQQQHAKDCPFCGGKPDQSDPSFIHPENRERTVWSANCQCCDASMLGDNPMHALAAWNRRPTVADQAKEPFGWATNDGRVVTAATFDNMPHSVKKPYIVPVYAHPAPQEVTRDESEQLASMTRMFYAACADLGLINEALGLDPDEGGAEPILAAIAALKERSC